MIIHTFIGVQFHVIFFELSAVNSDFSSNFSKTDSKVTSQTYAVVVSSTKLQISISFNGKNKSVTKILNRIGPVTEP